MKLTSSFWHAHAVAIFTLLAWVANPLTTQAQLPDYLPTEGLVGWWPFNGNANDESGNGNDGVVNGATLTEDRNGNPNSAYTFDGVNDYIDYPSGSSTTLNVIGDFSISFWLKTDQGVGPRTIFSFGDQINSNSGGITIGINDGASQPPIDGRLGYATQGQWNFSSALMTDDLWHFIVITLNVNTIKLFVDTNLDSADLSQPAALSWSGDRRVGAGNYGQIGFYEDLLDDIAIYNRALTPEEITALYTGQPVVTDCLDPEACNYEAIDEACVYPEPNLDCAGNCLNDTDGDGVCDENEVGGCTDPEACNYVAEATDDDGSCTLPPVLNLPENVSICEGDVTTLDAGAGYDSYLWSTGETTQTIQVSEAGTYTVEVGNAIAQGDNALPNYLPQDGLVGWWPFNGNANDESGNGNNGVVNGATPTTDRHGNANAAYDFDGEQDRISIAHNQSFNFTQELTIALWANVEEYGPNNQWLINKGFDPGTYNWGIASVADARFAASCVTDFNDYSSLTSVSYGTSEWVFWVYQYDGAELRLMKNGDVQISIAAQGEFLQNFEDVSIGYFPHNNLDVYGYFYNGKIDDIAIYNRALSEQEIQQLYTAQTLCSASATIEVIVQSLGCTDPEACNYNEAAGCDDNSCTYPAAPYLDCAGNCLNDTNNNGICDELDVPGCTFEGACNYNPLATVNDNSCFFATAVFDCNGNCQQDSNNNGICDQLEAIGAQLCGEGTVWDNSVGTCIGFDPCPADINDSGVVDVADLLLFLAVFGENCD